MVKTLRLHTTPNLLNCIVVLSILASFLSAPYACRSAQEHSSPAAQHDSATFFMFMERQVTKKLDKILETDVPDNDIPMLFQHLDSIRRKDSEAAGSSVESLIEATALLTLDGDFLAWTGIPSEILQEWIEYPDDQDRLEYRVYMIDDPSGLKTIHLKFSDYRISMVQLRFLSRRTPVPGTESLNLSLGNSRILLEYVPPSKRFSRTIELPEGLMDPRFNSCFKPVKTIDPGILSLPDWQPVKILKQISAPEFFAGNFLGIHSASSLLLMAIVLWIASQFLPVLARSGYARLMAALAGLLSAVVFGIRIDQLARSVIFDSRSAWWPEFTGEFDYSSALLPAAALLITGSLIRIILWFAAIVLYRVKSKDNPPRRRFVPGWICQASAVIILSPLFISYSGEVRQENISARLQNWIINRESVVPMALETNLLTLSDAAGLYMSEHSEEAKDHPALELWLRSDLHALEKDFGIQLLDIDRNVIDRFSPEFSLQPLADDAFRQVESSPESVLIIPPRLQDSGLRTSTVGISAIHSDQGIAGFLMIQISSGPESIKPHHGQWGDDVLLYVAREDWPAECPVDEPIDWSGLSSEPPAWQTDISGKFQLMLYRLPHSSMTIPEYVVCVLAIKSTVTHMAGVARLCLLAMLILIPGIFYKEVKRILKIRSQNPQGTFTRQLLGAFLLPVIILPIAFAASVHQLIQASDWDFQMVQIRHLYQQNLGILKDRIIDEALRVQISIEQQLMTGNTIIDHSENPWLVLDEFGRELIRGTGMMQSEIPFTTVGRIYQDRYFKGILNKAVVFQGIPVEGLVSLVILPFPCYNPVDSDSPNKGTFICELPISSQLLSSVQDPADIALEIYAGGSVIASNRPELFDTGFRSTRMKSGTFRRIYLDLQESSFDVNQLEDDYSITGAIRSENGQPVGALAISGNNSSFSSPSAKPQEWFVLATVFLLISGIAISIFFGHRIGQPIQELTQSAIRISSGDFTSRVAEKGVGETRFLSRTFNSMIDELQRQSRDLQERHAFISTVLSGMSSAILAVDESGRVITMNTAFISLFGLNDQEFIRQPVELLLGTLDCPELVDAFRNRRSSEWNDEQVIRLFRHGRTIHLATRFATLESPDGKPGYLTILDDVTGTIQSSKLQAYADLARRIAHEIKNPLTPIQLSIEHLRQAWEDRVPDFNAVFNQCLTMVQDEVQSLEHISSEFSRFARFPEPVFRNLDVRELIQEIESLYPVLPDGITMETVFPDRPLFGRFDHDQMKRVMINLVQNAIHAMPSGGHLVIRVTGVDNRIVIEVQDTGHGMDRETLLHLFEPYFSTKSEGTGLGLVITKAVIDAHDGDIQVSSNPGSGTCFTIRIPKVYPENDLAVEDEPIGGTDVRKNDTHH